MDGLISHIREPVKRHGAEQYLLITLLSFALSVTATRLFLQLTGYPQVGGGRLHIAHVLWGGLLLFVASLLPLILTNRWVYALSALLSGVGVGLFIDEVGKFITRTNDYFSPAAAPVIYALFLLTVLLYLEVRRPPSQDPRAELYRAMDDLSAVLDNDLEPHELTDLKARLQRVISHSEQPNLARLAAALLDFLGSDTLLLVPDRPTQWERIREWGRRLELRRLGRRRLKTLILVGFLLLGIPAAVAAVSLPILALAPGDVRDQTVATLVSFGQLSGAFSPAAAEIRLALTGLAGLPLLVAAGFMAVGREKRAIRIGYIGLLLSLTAINLLVFYFDQFRTIFDASLQFGLLMGVIRYRTRYLLQ